MPVGAEPEHPVVVLVLGVGRVSIGLTPALSSSVAPNGMDVPESDDPVVVPAADEVLPLAEVPDAVVQALVLPLAEPKPLMPPPSNVELADVPLDALVMPEGDEPELQEGETAGLRPPGLSSVAPRPMPTPVDPLDVLDPIEPLEPGIPSGEVIPMAGAVGEVLVAPCASAAPQLRRIAVIVQGNRRIASLL